MDGILIGSDHPYTKLSFDSRTLQAGEIFIALKGETFDGHHFVSQAIEKGAAAVIIAHERLLDTAISIPIIRVDDTTKALGKFAHVWRNRFNIPVVGITGSCGKTTVKAMLSSILSLSGHPLIPEGSFNNHFGLPFSLLKLTSAHQYAVMEVGTNGFGEIEYLTKILSPTHSIITNVQPAHLAGLETLENIAKEKGDIYKYLSTKGTAIINADQPHISLWRSLLTNQKVVTFGLEQADVTATDIQLSLNKAQFKLNIMGHIMPIILCVPGLHNVMNALAAATVAIQLDIPITQIVEGLQSFFGVKGRLNYFKAQRGACIIDDSYNANPASFKAAIDVLAQASGNTVLVMGDMGELGAQSLQYHAEIGQYAFKQGIHQLFAVGDLSQQAVVQFGKGGRAFKDKQSLINALVPALDSNTTVLIKGSRSTRMEDILTVLTAS